MSERRRDWRPLILFALGPLGWLVLLGWAVVAFLSGLVAGLTGRLDDGDGEGVGVSPRRRYRRADP